MRTDFELDDTGDIKIVNGHFSVIESDTQHVNAIFMAHKGEYKEHPLVGFGATKYLKGVRNDNQFKRDLKIQLEYDGYSNPNIDLTQGYEQLKIDI